MYTRIPVVYRDAANFKIYSEIVLEGDLTGEDRDRIRSSLIDGMWFDPRQIWLSHLGCGMDGFPLDTDHPWHEMWLDDAVSTTATDDVWGTALQLFSSLRRQTVSVGWK